MLAKIASRDGTSVSHAQRGMRVPILSCFAVETVKPSSWPSCLCLGLFGERGSGTRGLVGRLALPHLHPCTSGVLVLQVIRRIRLSTLCSGCSDLPGAASPCGGGAAQGYIAGKRLGLSYSHTPDNPCPATRNGPGSCGADDGRTPHGARLVSGSSA